MPQAKQKQVQPKDPRTRILLVDDHAVVRYGIAQLVNREGDLTVCGEEEEASWLAKHKLMVVAMVLALVVIVVMMLLR